MNVGTAIYQFDGFTQWHQINRWYFDPQNTGKVTTPDRLREHLLSLPPDSHFYFDTEGQWFKNLRDNDVTSSMWKIQINNYHDLYDIGAATLPKATMVEYSFPMRNYWHQKDEWREKNLALAPLMKRLDGACPSIYDPYKNEELAWSSEIDDWKEANQQVRMALEMHDNVYVFVFHRYHMPNLRFDWGWELIGDEAFTSNCQAAADARFKGKKIKGFIHWSNDTANIALLDGQDPATDTPAQARTRGHMEGERMPGEPSDAYIHRTHGRVLKLLRMVV